MAKYDEKFKTKALLLWHRNDYNTSKTCKALGIRHETLKSWKNTKLGKQVLADQKVPQTGKGVEKEIDKTIQAATKEFHGDEKKLKENIFCAQMEVVNQIRKIIPTQRNAYALSQLLTTLSNLDNTQEPANQSHFLTLIQNQIINEKDNNPDKDYIEIQ